MISKFVHEVEKVRFKLIACTWSSLLFASKNVFINLFLFRYGLKCNS